MKTIGRLKGECTTPAYITTKGTTFPAPTSWCESVELLPAKGAKREARVWLKIHGGSTVWSQVFISVKVDASISDQMAVCAAANKAHRVGSGYSWVLWARKQIMAKWPNLIDDEAFQKKLKQLTHEWMPRVSEKGRMHCAKVLGLPSFTAEAFEGSPTK